MTFAHRINLPLLGTSPKAALTIPKTTMPRTAPISKNTNLITLFIKSPCI